MAFDLDGATRQILHGCVMLSDSGVRLYTPDGKANYHALWTRDFAYMAHGAGDLLPLDDMIACVNYLIGGAREDGWIPDRVEPSGFARYTAGMDGFPALPNLDTGTYLVLAAGETLDRMAPEAAKAQFLIWREALEKGLWCLPLGDSGLIVNETTPPHSPYGFTDCISKTGELAMESLILWEALGVMSRYKALCGLDDTREAKARADISQSLAGTLTDPDTGMLLSATGVCRQIDLWASCYALYLDFPLDETQRDRIARYLIDGYGSIVQKGQLRHLPAGQYWEALFEPVKPGEYQNGAFWATPIEWLVAALSRADRVLAEITLNELLRDFEARGIFECVNGDYTKLDTYVVSATNARAAARWLRTHRAIG